MSDAMKEFDCADCGQHVVRYGPAAAQPGPVRCPNCIYIASIPDLVERKLVRERLIENGEIGGREG